MFTHIRLQVGFLRITGGNFRLLHRVFVRIERTTKINGFTVISDEVVEAVCSTLVIGAEEPRHLSLKIPQFGPRAF